MKDLAIDYRYLKAFMVTAKLLNFSKAAEELNIAQSAVSRQIKLLEDSINQQLIIRSSKKVILTEKGHALLRLMEQFETNIQDVFFSQSSKKIRVGILHGLLETWFSDLIVDFTKNHKHQLIIEINAMEKLKEKLLNNHYDIIFTTDNIQSELVTSLKLFDEKMVMISKNDINPRDGHLLPWIVYNENDHLYHLFKKRSEQVIAVNSMTSIISLTKKGVGIAIVPDHLLKTQDNLKIYEVKGLPKQAVFLSTLNFQTLPEHLKILIEMIKKKVL